MARNTSVTLGEHFDKFAVKKYQCRTLSVSGVVRADLRKLEEDETKLQILRDKLQAGEDGLLVEILTGKISSSFEDHAQTTEKICHTRRHVTTTKRTVFWLRWVTW